jgi:RNA polymerase sigma-70 factor, ECF subfamily
LEAGSYDLSVSNEELLFRCQQQDQEALQTLFRRHERPVYGLLLRMLGNREDAEEALADVFVKVWKSAGKFRGDSKFTTWLYRISSNSARDVLRARRGHQTVSFEDMAEWDAEAAMNSKDTGDDPREALLRAEDRHLLMAAIQKLSEEDRLLITLYHLQELSYEEISQIVDSPPANLKVRLFRARQRLRQHFEELSDGAPRPDNEKEGQDHAVRTDSADSAGVQPPAIELP